MRVGNAASLQFQLDVYGEVMDALYQARRHGLSDLDDAWRMQPGDAPSSSRRAWKEPDEGIWEVRGERQHFTHSKVMAWVAFDRAIKARRAVRVSTGRSSAGRPPARRDPPRDLRAGLRREIERLRPVVRFEASSTPVC